MKTLFTFFVFFTFQQFSFSQEKIEVYQSTIKINGVSEETMLFGFCEGDEIILNLEELTGKELKEVEIREYPNSSKFMDFKTTSIKDKIIIVQRTGIYQFRFANGAIKGRICSIKIDRKPKTIETAKFNTNVYWKTITDTTTSIIQETYLEKSDTIISDFYSSSPQVSSKNAINGNLNYQVLNFALPTNTIAWSFYIGTGNEAKQEYERARKDFIKMGAKVVSTIHGYGPMAALALTGVNYMNKVQGEDNVKYYFLSSAEDVKLYYARQTFYHYKKGDVVNEASQMKAPLTGTIYLAIENDNTIDPILVTIKATAIIVNKTYNKRPKTVYHLEQKEVPYLMNN